MNTYLSSLLGLGAHALTPQAVLRAENSLLFTDKPMTDLERRFHLFDIANPDVWHSFSESAEAIYTAQKGNSVPTRYSARAIIEAIGNARLLTQEGVAQPRVNHDFSPYYAQKLANRNPKFVAFFRLQAGRHLGAATAVVG